MIDENDIIAKYVKERFPNILQTSDFALFKLSEVLKECVNDMKKSLEKIDFSELKKAIERMNENEN